MAEAAVFDLSRPRRIHLIGVGGTGMSAIAEVLAGMGHAVTGSDVVASAVIERLRSVGVRVRLGHDAGAVAGAEVVMASSAVPATNVELVAAAGAGVPVLTRGQLLGSICALRRTLAVAGTHGKTTTSSMLLSILRAAGRRPSCVIGGDIHGVGSGAVWDEGGDWFVVEADESDGTFLDLPAEGVIVTNVESDHLEHYGGLAQLQAAFGQFLAGARRWAVTNADDPGARSLPRPGPGRPPTVTTFGRSPDASVVVSAVSSGRGDASFDVTADGRRLGRITLAVPGPHNVANAAAAATLALRSGVDFASVVTALGGYREVTRRFEWRGERGGVTYIDDYGHLPSEVAAVVATARAGGWGRVVAVFQPHRYSRTQALGASFADAFVDADVVVLTGVYAAGEAPRPGVSGRLILDAVRAAHPDAELHYVEERAGLGAAVAALLRPGDLCLTLGAGDVAGLAGELLAAGRSS